MNNAGRRINLVISRQNRANRVYDRRCQGIVPGRLRLCFFSLFLSAQPRRRHTCADFVYVQVVVIFVEKSITYLRLTKKLINARRKK